MRGIGLNWALLELMFALFVSGQTSPAASHLPLRFEPDQRQGFLGRAPRYSVLLTGSTAVFTLGSDIVRMKLQHANPYAKIAALDRLPGVTNYLIGRDRSRWRMNVAGYARVECRGVYPGVDLVYHASQDDLEYDLVVHPGASPSAVWLSFEGAQKIWIDDRGDLLLRAGAGELRIRQPRVYQELNGARIPVEAAFTISSKNEAGFRIATYDRSRTLIIDPVIGYATYLGGKGSDAINGIAVDSTGAAYVTGRTDSPDFPAGGARPAGASTSGFVSKMNPAGTALVYTTYFGGTSGSTVGRSIALDSQGNLYITGETSSTNFPTTSGAYQTTPRGGATDGFVLKLNAAGSVPVYSTRLGGSGADFPLRIAVNQAGNAFIAGATASQNFPTSPGALKTTYGGGPEDGFVTQLSADGKALVYSTFLGGSTLDQVTGLDVDAAGNAYLTGETDSTNFPTSSGVLQPTLPSKGNNPFKLVLSAFVTKLSPSGAMIYSTYLGGTGYEFGAGISVDAQGNAYVTGSTASKDLPGTSGSYQPGNAGSQACFISRLNATATAVNSTYFGGSGEVLDGGLDIKVDSNGEVHLVGVIGQAGLHKDAPANDIVPRAFAAKFSGDLVTLVEAVEVATKASANSLAIREQPASLAKSGHAADLFAKVLTYIGGIIDSGGTFESALDPTAIVTYAKYLGGDEDAMLVCLYFAQLVAAQVNLTFVQLANAAITHTDPVSTANGEIFSDLPPDFSLGGPLPLTFRRYYASMLKASGFAGAMGNNWMHNFDLKLTTGASAATVQLFRGKTVKFSQTASGGWQLSSTEKLHYQLAGAGGSYQFLDPSDNLIYTFSSAGVLMKIEDRNGNALAVTQSSNGPIQVSDGLGRSLSFSYTGEKLAQAQDQTGRTITFTYTGDDLSSDTDANGNTTMRTYTTAGSLSGLLAAATLPAGNQPLAQTFDAQGRVSAQTDSRGNVLKLEYDKPSGGVTTLTNALSTALQHAHQGGNFLKFTDATGQSISYAYDVNNRRTSVADRLGDKSVTTYHSPSGYVASVTDTLGATTSYSYTAQTQGPFTYYVRTGIQYADGTTASLAYDSFGNVTAITDSAGKVIRRTYNQRGQVVTSTNPAGGVTTFVYNDDGAGSAVQSPSGDTVALAYDPAKRLSQITYADGSAVSFGYDNRDNVVQQTDERGKTYGRAHTANNVLSSTSGPGGPLTGFTYDSDGNVSSFTDGVGKSSAYAYNELGLLKTLTTATGETYAFGYDALNRRISVADPAGKGVRFTYDREGVLLSQTDALSRGWTYTSDKMGRVTSIVTPLAAKTVRAYDKLGRLLSETDPLSKTTSYRYDARGLVSAIALPGGISASFARNDLGLITGVTDPSGRVWNSMWDAAGRLVSRTDPLGRTESYAFDGRRRPITVTTPEGSVNLTYDAAGNLVRRLYSDGTDLKYSYDDNNRRLGGGGVSLAYDANGRIVSSNGLAISRDDSGRISRITYADGKSVAYSYDGRGLLTSVTDWVGGATTFTYNDAHELVAITRPNGVVTQFTYDKDTRLAGITETKGAQLSSVTVTRDAASKIVSTNRSLPSVQTPAPGVLQLGYDAAHQVSGFRYDGMGRLTSDGFRSYTWDLASRLTSYNGADGSASFTYDDFGSRISRTTADASQTYAINYALSIPSPAIISASGADQRYYVHLPSGSLLYSIEAADNTRHFYHYDAADSTLFLTGDDGSITDTYGVTPYGETVTHNGPTASPFTFLGRYGVMQEDATSLYYMRARYYDSATARFISPDTVRSNSPRAINPYQYASGNPVRFSDPLGLEDTGSFDLGASGDTIISREFYPTSGQGGSFVDTYGDGSTVKILTDKSGNIILIVHRDGRKENFIYDEAGHLKFRITDGDHILVDQITQAYKPRLDIAEGAIDLTGTYYYTEPPHSATQSAAEGNSAASTQSYTLSQPIVIVPAITAPPQPGAGREAGQK